MDTIHSLVDGNVDKPHFAATKIKLLPRFFWEHEFSFSLRYIIRSEIAGSYEMCLTFKKPPNCFQSDLSQLYPHHKCLSVPVVPNLDHYVVLSVFLVLAISICVLVSHSDFSLGFPHGKYCGTLLHEVTCYTSTLFSRRISLALFFYKSHWLLSYSVLRALYILRIPVH